jgi:hypothetical protein
LMHLPKQAPPGAYVPVDLKRMIREVRVNMAEGFDPGAVKDLLRSVGVAVDVIDVNVRGTPVDRKPRVETARAQSRERLVLGRNREWKAPRL